MGLIDKIKEDTKRSGSNKGKFVYLRDGDKKRLRFLQDMDDGREVIFHDSFSKGIKVPCQEMFGKECPYCGDEELRTRSQYAWSVYDYDDNEVKIFMQPVNNCSAIPSLVSMYENYGTLTDRDYIIERKGKQQNTTYSVVPMDRQKFRNSKAKPLSNKAFLDLLAKAFPEEDTEDEEVKPKRKKASQSNKSMDFKDLSKEANDVFDADDENENEYEDMSPKELYKLCKEREIEVEPKKNAKYYINLLLEDDKAHDDWDDEDEEDEEDEWD